MLPPRTPNGREPEEDLAAADGPTSIRTLVEQQVASLRAADFPVFVLRPWEQLPRRPRGAVLLLVSDDEPQWHLARGPKAFDIAQLRAWFGHLTPGLVGVFADGFAPDAYCALIGASPTTRGGAVLITTTAEHFAAWVNAATEAAPKGKVLGWRGVPSDAPREPALAVSPREPYRP